MANTEVGAAYVTIHAKMASSFNSEISQGVDGGINAVAGKGFSAASALGNLLANMVGKVVESISSVTDAAVSRVDTMANFPVVMQNLGYNADEAATAVQAMSERLKGLPTSLDSMVGVTQQLAPLTSSLAEATDIGLAFNDMLLASGSSTADVDRAMRQYTQMLGKGKVDLQSWTTLQEVMPGQLNQLAQAMLGVGATSGDLYQAMLDGSVSFDDFNQAVLRLDHEGFGEFASYAEQAKTATGGIGTAMDNLKTALTRAVGDIIEAIGRDNIVTIISGIAAVIGALGTTIAQVITGIRESGFGDIIQYLVDSFSNGTTRIGEFAGVLKNSGEIVDTLKERWQAFVDFFEPAVSAYYDHWPEISQAWEDMKISVQGAVDSIQPYLDDLSETLERLGFDVSEGLLPAIADAFGERTVNEIEAFGEIVSFIVQLVGILAEDLAIYIDFLKGFFETIVNFFVGVKETLQDVFDFIKGLFSDFVEAASGNGDNLVGFWQDIPDRIGGFFGSLPTLLGTHFQGASDSAKSWAESMAGHFDGIPDIIAQKFSGLGDKISSAMGNVKAKVSAFTETIGGISVSVPQVSWASFATGGIVDKPTFGLFGEAGTEALVPLESGAMNPFADAIAKRLNNGRLGSVTNYNITIDGATINSRPEMREAFIDFMTAINDLGVM